MATERVLALAALAAAVACAPITDKCQANTLLVTVTLAGATVSADQLVVDVALDGGAAHESTLSHTPGQAAGNVVVQFPAGYPRGHRVDVTVTASAGGAVLGSGGAGTTLGGGCAVAPLTVDDNGGGADLAVDDTADLAGADLSSGGDLSTGRDLAGTCVPTGVENCFNGIDDDCNGHIDCDDGACSPIARCVAPAGAPFAYVTEEPANGSCPTDSASNGTIYQSNPSGGGCNAGSCACDTHGCTTTVTRDPSCPSGAGSGSPLATVTDVCDGNLNGQNNLFVATPTGTPTCTATGSATPVTPPTLTKMLECTVNAVGGGCANGKVCAPIGTQQCVAAAGSQPCPSGYPTGMTWYASYTDNRACGCSCAPTTCAAAGLRWYSSSTCTGAGVSQGNDICSNDYSYTKLGGGCTPSATLGSTSIQFNGATTICCE
jgi:hypothetical protein